VLSMGRAPDQFVSRTVPADRYPFTTATEYWTTYVYSGGLFLTADGWGSCGYYKLEKFPFPDKTVQAIDYRTWHSGVSDWNYGGDMTPCYTGTLILNGAMLDGHAESLHTGDFIRRPLDSVITLFKSPYNKHLY